jgi:serine protease Do
MNNSQSSNTKPIRLPRFILAGSILAAVSAFAVNALDEKDPRKPAIVLNAEPLSRDAKMTTSFAPVIKRVSPSVVKVFVSGKASQVDLRDFSGHPLFRDFFRGGQGEQRRLEMPKQQGIGSGVIATADGYVLTNNHVVEHASDVKVALQDGREFSAKVVGKDPKTDLAVLKLDAKSLPAIEMTDSDQAEVGDTVLAIGNPFGIGQTVTTGIVSATGRSAIGLDYEDFIQTDAAINPGNSGGALVDAEGRLIGINTAILSRSGGNQGIGFAIPTNLVRDVMDSLIADGKVTRGQLGVMIQDVTPAIARKFNTEGQTGALVGDVTPDGPAEKAGVTSGDVIVEFAGKAVKNSRNLKLQVARVKPGENVTVKVLRDGKEKSLTVKIGEQPDARRLAQADREENAKDEGTLNGVAVDELDRRARTEYDIPSSVRGAVVTEVSPNSAAADAGLQAGDVILEINREPVKSVEDAVRLTDKPADKTTLLKIWSRGAQRFVVVDENKVG